MRNVVIAVDQSHAFRIFHSAFPHFINTLHVRASGACCATGFEITVRVPVHSLLFNNVVITYFKK